MARPKGNPNLPSTPAGGGETTRKTKLEIVAGRVDTALRALAALEKTASYQELDAEKREAVSRTIHEHVTRVLKSFQEGKRGKATTFRF